MTVDHLVAVVIPVYKESIDRNELMSLNQCIKVLKDYHIIFIAPKGLNTGFYELACENKIPFKIKVFEDSYFESVSGYNKLMLSPGFYKSFFNYKFILICQLDAFVFKDELLYWCEQNYDFIGAPHAGHENTPGEMQFLKNYTRILGFLNRYLKTKHKISNVGNGGFSLRKTRSCYWLLKLLKSKAENWGPNEDGFFKYWGNLLYPAFKLPTNETALKFAIEVSPKASLVALNNVLPFGCHAFEKYEWETWKPYILPDVAPPETL